MTPVQRGLHRMAAARQAAVGALRRAGQVLRSVGGAPDYDRYLAHMQQRHPGALVLSPAEFACRRLEEKYSRPGAKCC